MHGYLTFAPFLLPEKRLPTLLSTESRSSLHLSSMLEFLYFANWYQAEKRGWTDFNFASFHPQIVRYRPENLHKLPNRSAGREDLKLTDCRAYDYILIKSPQSSANLAAWLSAAPSCRAVKVKRQEQDWVLFTRF